MGKFSKAKIIMKIQQQNKQDGKEDTRAALGGCQGEL